MDHRPIEVTFADVDWRAIRRVTVVPFADDVGGWVLPLIDGRPEMLSGTVPPGEDPGAVLFELLLQRAGYRQQGWYPFAMDGDHLVVWSHGGRYGGSRPHTRVDRWSGTVTEAAALLAARGDEWSAALLTLADERRRHQSDEEFYASPSWVLEPAYLAGANPREGSGFGGTEEDWRALRIILCDAIPGDSSVLDVGCANGYLMECLVGWCAERGIAVEPYGIDISEGLVAEARRRLPQWADRIWVGNAVDWVPPDGRRFDVVHLLLDCVPMHAFRTLVTHHLDRVVADGGRLLVSHYLGDAAPELREMGFPVSGLTRAPTRPGRPGAQPPSAWIDKSG